MLKVKQRRKSGWCSDREDGVNSWPVFGHPTCVRDTQVSLSRWEKGLPSEIQEGLLPSMLSS